MSRSSHHCPEPSLPFRRTLSVRKAFITVCLTGVLLATEPVVGTDPSFQWARTFGGSGADTGTSLATTLDGNVRVGGFFYATVDFNPASGVDSHTSLGDADAFGSVFLADGTYSGVVTFGGSNFDPCRGVAVDESGNHYYPGRFAGTVDFDPGAGVDNHTGTSNSYDAFVTRINADETYGWTRHFGGSATEEANAIALDPDGNVIVAGYFSSVDADFDPGPGVDLHARMGNEDIFVTKLLADGAYGWTRTMGGIQSEQANAAAVDASGNVIVAGSFSGTVDFDPGAGVDSRNSNGGSTDLFVTKLNADASYAWTAVIGGPALDRANAVAAAADDSLVVGGNFSGIVDFDPGAGVDTHISVSNSSDACLLRLLTDGAYAWGRHFGESQDDATNGVRVDANGNVMICGRFRSTFDFDPGPGVDLRSSNGESDVYVAAYNLTGAYGGAYTFGGSGNDVGNAIALDPAGNLFVAGTFVQSFDFNTGAGTDIHSSNGSTDVFVVKLHYAEVETPGACCVGASCTYTTPSSCSAAGGEFHGAFSLCQNVACGGACCTNFQCEFLTLAQCAAQGGSFQGLGIPCDSDLCGGTGPSTSWSTFQHDAQRTGRTGAVVPDEPNRVWSILAGDDPFNQNRFAPTLGPDGTVYISADPNLVAVSPAGQFLWQTSISPRATGGIRQDGHLFLSRNGSFAKIDHNNGAALCSAPTWSAYPAAMDAQGNCYVASVGSPWMLHKIGPGCNVLWSYNGADSAASHVALGLDGGVHAAGIARYLKLDPANGSELWSVPTGDAFVGAPAIAPDGTIYHTLLPNQLVAVHPDGTERWLHTLSLPGLNVNTESPAVGADGTAYVLAKRNTTSEFGLVAISPDGVEQWTFLETIAGGSDPISPVVDGAGKILFSAESYVIAVSSTGAELWRVDVGAPDRVNASPAIGADGMLYVTTELGYLIAYHEGCAEPPPQSPPYMFRRVVTEGDFINELNIAQLKTFELHADGTVTFLARVGQYDTVFYEQPDGSFTTVTHGDLLNSHVIDSVSMPRRDGAGRNYLPAYTDVGPVIYFDDALYLAEANFLPDAPATIVSFSAASYVDHDETGRFLVYGKRTTVETPGILSVDTDTASVTTLIQEDQAVGGFVIDDFLTSPVQGYADDGIPLLRAYNGQFAILTPTQLIVKTGDILDDQVVSTLDLPRRNAEGSYYFLANESVYGRTPAGVITRRYGIGDTVAGQPLLTINYYVVDNANNVAYSSALLDERFGVFYGSDPVAIEAVTQIDEVGVAEVGSGVANSRVETSLNDSGQVALIARRSGEPYALFVATPLMPLDMNGDGAINLLDLPDFTDCLTGPGQNVDSNCTRADADGDCECGLIDVAALQRMFGASGP